MQYVSRYNLKPNKANVYKAWLDKNAALLATDAPEGWTYLGTWFTVRELGRYQCETRWELTDYSALGSGFGSEALLAAYAELDDIVDSAPGETTLMKSTQDIYIAKGS